MKLSRNKKLIITNVALLVLLAAGVTYAWFASTYGNIVEADQVQVVADSELQISFDGLSWSSYLNLNNQGSPVDLTQLRFTDITGSGDSTGKAPSVENDKVADGAFLKPALDQMDGYAAVDSTSDWTTPKANKDYIKFNLHMRSTDRLNVYLGTGASVTPQSAKLLNLSDSEANTNNVSALGKFSRDLVAGAVRVSMVENAAEDSHNRLFTWIPCPQYYLDAGPSEAISNYTIYDNATLDAPSTTAEYSKIVTDTNQNAENPQDRGTRVHPYQHWFYANKSTTTMTQLITKVVTGTITNETQQPIASLTSNKNNEGYYTATVTVYIWLEGCDNEARRAFVDGRFNVLLKLSSVDAT